MLNSADDLIASTELNPDEAAYIHERLMLAPMVQPAKSNIGHFSESFQLMPMLVARTLSEIRPEDSVLSSLISSNEFLIKTFGKKRLTREAVEGAMVVTHKFWRNNDPLGVYKPGDMFYVDDNHRWMRYFPIMILAPSAFVLVLGSFATFIHAIVR